MVKVEGKHSGSSRDVLTRRECPSASSWTCRLRMLLGSERHPPLRAPAWNNLTAQKGGSSRVNSSFCSKSPLLGCYTVTFTVYPGFSKASARSTRIAWGKRSPPTPNFPKNTWWGREVFSDSPEFFTGGALFLYHSPIHHKPALSTFSRSLWCSGNDTGYQDFFFFFFSQVNKLLEIIFPGNFSGKVVVK